MCPSFVEPGQLKITRSEIFTGDGTCGCESNHITVQIDYMAGENLSWKDAIITMLADNLLAEMESHDITDPMLVFQKSLDMRVRAAAVQRAHDAGLNVHDIKQRENEQGEYFQ